MKEIIFIIGNTNLFKNIIFVKYEDALIANYKNPDAIRKVLHMDTEYISVHKEFYKRLEDWNVDLGRDSVVIDALSLHLASDEAGKFTSLRNSVLFGIQQRVKLTVDTIVELIIEWLVSECIKKIMISAFFTKSESTRLFTVSLINVITSIDTGEIFAILTSASPETVKLLDDLNIDARTEEALYRLLNRNEISLDLDPKYVIKFMDQKNNVVKEYVLNNEY